MHRLHERAQHVNCRVTYPIVAALQRLRHLPAHLLPKAGERRKTSETGLAGHQSPQAVQLLFQLRAADSVLIALLGDEAANGGADQLLFVLGK
jgi:hypothetical protein